MQERKIHLPICLEMYNFRFKTENMQYHNLQVLSNGLVVCKIKITNYFNKEQFKICTALIDTGAECSAICNSIFDTFDKKEKVATGISTIHMKETVNAYRVIFNIPINDYWSHETYAICRDLSIREEYDAIIGMNTLRNYVFKYDGYNNKASIASQ